MDMIYWTLKQYFFNSILFQFCYLQLLDQRFRGGCLCPGIVSLIFFSIVGSIKIKDYICYDRLFKLAFLFLKYFRKLLIQIRILQFLYDLSKLYRFSYY